MKLSNIVSSLLLVSVLGIIFLTGCGVASGNLPASTPAATEVSDSGTETEPEPTGAQQTATPAPTSTSLPSPEPSATNSPLPSATATESPTPPPEPEDHRCGIGEVDRRGGELELVVAGT